MKKLLLLMLGVLIALPAMARDFTYTHEGKTLTYTVIDEYEKIVEIKIGQDSRGNYVSGTLIIPSIVEDVNGEKYTVLYIGENAFLGCFLSSVTIPESVIYIGENAFFDCTTLKKAEFGSIESILNCEFGNLYSNPLYYARNLYINGTEINDLVIPETVSSIGDNIFSRCYRLTSVTIPESVTSIGDRAFYGCYGLTFVTIPNSVTSIGDDAFEGCTSLTKAEFASVESICNCKFGNSSSNPLCYARNLYINGIEINDLAITETVTSIGNYAFYGCSGLKEVTIADGTSELNFGKNVFKGTGIETLHVGRNISWNSSDLSSSPFYNITTLKNLTIGNTVTLIGDNAFSGCSGLKEVTIADGTSELTFGMSVFKGAGIETLHVGRNISWNSSDWSSIPFYNITTLKNLTIGNTVTSIGSSAFYGCSGLTSVTIPASVTSIGNSAFNYCSGLTSVTIPNSVTSIGDYAFNECSGLTSVTIPNSVTSIGNYAFSGCSGLKEVTIADGTSDMNFGKSVFKGAGIETLHVGRNISWSTSDWSSIPFYNITTLKNLTIGNTVISIGYGAFSGCSGLTSVTIPNSVTSIGYGAFSGCSGLTSVTIPESVTSIGYDAFYGCSGLTELSLPGSVESIDYRAFYGCSGLTSVTIPESVTSIGNYAFSGCSGLTSVTVLATVPPEIRSETWDQTAYKNIELNIPEESFEDYLATAWRNFDKIKAGNIAIDFYNDDVFKYRTINIPGNPIAYVVKGDYYALTDVLIPERFTDLSDPSNPVRYYVTQIGIDAFRDCKKLKSVNFHQRSVVSKIADNAFSGCNNLDTITVPSTLRTIGDNAFSDASKLKYLVLNNNLETIGGGAFSGCTGLTSVTFSNALTSIGNEAFNNCTGLTEISLPGLVESIGNSAFYGCKGLTSVTLSGALTSIGNEAFKNCNGLTEISIPKSVKSIGEYAFEYCFSLTKAEFGSIESICNCEFGNSFSNPLRYAHKLYINGREIKDLVIPESVKSIGAYAFQDCSGLTSVTIPNSVNSIGESAFSSCSALTSITLPESLKTISKHAFSLCQALEEINFNNALDSIGDWAFYGCHRLTSLTLPESLKTIGEYAFYGCKNLAEITFNNKLDSIGDGAFCDCSALTSITLPESLKAIGKNAFRQCYALKEITFNEGLESIGEHAFDRCSSVSKITIPGSMSSLDPDIFGGYLNNFKELVLRDSDSPFNLDNGKSWLNNVSTLYLGRPLSTTLAGLTNLENVTLGYQMETIQSELFKGCTGLTTLYLGSSLKTVEASAFSGCTGLTEVTLSPTVETIEESAFDGCTELANIIMGAEVKSIGANAFNGAKAENICITALTPPTAPNNTFSNYNGTLYLQNQEAIDAYYDAYTCWDRFNSVAMVVPTSIDVTYDKIQGTQGMEIQLTAAMYPSNTTLQEIFWSSTDPEVAVVDKNGKVTIKGNGKVASRAAEIRECKIIARTLYADGPVAEVLVKSNGEISGIETIYQDDVDNSADINYNAPYQVYNFNGVLVGSSRENLLPGFYIIRQGNAVKKIAVK